MVGYVAAAIGGELDFGKVGDAAWIGWPEFTTPSATWSVVPMFLPVVLVLIAENVGHVRSVAHLTEDPSLNAKTGPALLADGLATTIAGMGGGSATTTYGENIGVMTATRVFSTAAYWVAALVAIALGMSPKFGALLNTIPSGVLGGVTVALYGLIGLIGVKIWMDNQRRLLAADQPVHRGDRPGHRHRRPDPERRRHDVHRHRAGHHRGGRGLPRDAHDQRLRP